LELTSNGNYGCPKPGLAPR